MYRNSKNKTAPKSSAIPTRVSLQKIRRPSGVQLYQKETPKTGTPRVTQNPQEHSF